MARSPLAGRDGFTLLEVLIAFAILSVAIVSLIQLTSQGLRLLKVSGDHQQAVQLADRIAMDTQVNPDDVKPDTPVIDNGDEGGFSWERRIARIALPPDIEARATTPGQEAPGLYSVLVSVHWGNNHAVQVATLRAPTASAAPNTSTTSTGTPTTQGAPGAPGQSTPGQTSAPGGAGLPSSFPARPTR